MAIKAGILQPKDLSKKQRHHLLNKLLEYHPEKELHKYISANNTTRVLDYKRHFIGQVYGRLPWNPEQLKEMLAEINDEMIMRRT
jgi:hypothetical protein